MPKVSWQQLESLRHKLGNDRMALHKIELHLRDWHRTSGVVQDDVVCAVIKELVDFNCDRLGSTLEALDEIILHVKAGKTQTTNRGGT